LYNWYAIHTNELAPEGWHVPTDSEWTKLVTFIGDETNAGGKLKEAGFTHWKDPNEGATNESGFFALPGGFRDNQDGAFLYIGGSGSWWSSTNYDFDNSWSLGMSCVVSGVFRALNNVVRGMSVRCVRDY